MKYRGKPVEIDEGSDGDRTDGMTEADLERWRYTAEHGRPVAQVVAKAILKRHAERLNLPKPIAGEAKA